MYLDVYKNYLPDLQRFNFIFEIYIVLCIA